MTRRADRLVDGYDLVAFDLDGVLYLIDQPVPGAPEAVGRLHRSGMAVAYVTNNASRRAAEVASLLTEMGIPARPDEVLTSAAATAEVLADRLPAGSPVLVVGAEALRAEIREVGLTPVTDAEAEPAAVAQGYGPRVGWSELAEAAVAIRAGALWVATNTDRTLPSPRGPLPGNGALVAALRTALDRDPDVVVGKPEPALFGTAARRAGSGRTLVVGDRLDTDIEGAGRAGLDSLLVLTGVSTVTDLLAAPPPARPSYVSPDLSGLFEPERVVRLPAGTAGGGANAGRHGPGGPERPGPERTAGADPAEEGSAGWRVTVTDGMLRLAGSGRPLDALAALCAAAWAGQQRFEGLAAEGERAQSALRDLGLSGV